MDDLFQKRAELKSRISSYFDGDEDVVNYGDIGYQALLSELEEVEADISELKEF